MPQPQASDRPPNRGESTSKRTERLALAGVLLVATVLRFTALGWGLLHTPISDEQDFVENVGEMMAHGDWDHRFYEYPGLFFYLLRPVLALAPESRPYKSDWDRLPPITHFGRSGYLAARGVVAAVGVLSVFLVFRLGVALLGTWGGLAASLLMAVSPVEVFVCHEVRPDVVLESTVLLALLAFRRLGVRLRDDLVSGVAIGAAAAVKFTGALIMAPYLIARWLAPGPRLRGLLTAWAAAALFWLLATPYALVKPRSFLNGALAQVSWHYRGRGVFSTFWKAFPFYVATLSWSLGYVGAALAVLGLFAVRRRLADWAPALAYGCLLVLVLSSAYMHWHRLVLSGVCVASLLAAAGLDFLRRGRAVFAYLLLPVAALLPLDLSVAYLRGLLAPGARDLAVAWVGEHEQDGARIFNSVRELGLDRDRFEVVRPSGTSFLDRLVARQSDAVVWHWLDRSPLSGFDVLFRAEPRLPGGAFGQVPELSLRSLHDPIVVLAAPPALAHTTGPCPWTTRR